MCQHMPHIVLTEVCVHGDKNSANRCDGDLRDYELTALVDLLDAALPPAL